MIIPAHAAPRIEDSSVALAEHLAKGEGSWSSVSLRVTPLTAAETSSNQHHMSDMRKITAMLPAPLLDAAMEVSGRNLTETLRVALRDYNHHAASQRLLAARGKVRFELDWRELRGKGDDD